MKSRLYIAILLLSLFGCKGTEQMSQINVSQSYDMEPGRPDVEYQVFITSDTIAKVYLEMPLPPEGTRWLVRYGLFRDFKSSNALDTGSLALWKDEKGHQVLSTEIQFKKGENSLLRFEVIHTGRSRKFTYFTHILGADSLNSQSLLPLAEDGSIFFKGYLSAGEEMRFRVSERNPSTRLLVRFYEDTRALAPPPFSTSTNLPTRYKPDSTFYLEVRNFLTEPLIGTKQGIYMVVVDSIKDLGFTIIRPVTGYPYMISPDQMIHSARYIMSNKEFKNCIEAADKKSAIDAFWIELSGNTNRARTMMADYYHRVEEANRLFICDTEGWKSDRGMIFIVFGPPDMVYQSEKGESWVYGEVGYSRSLIFQFNLIPNPLVNNDLRLERVPTYKDPWYMAVNQWRR